MKKILIASPANKITGGTELLQQLCYTLRNFDLDAFMLYPSNQCDSSFLRHFDNIYRNPVASFEDNSNTVVVIPETMAYLLPSIKNAEPVMWWLSVDNYIARNKKLKNPLRLYYRRLIAFLKYNPRIRLIDNLVQSQYAYDYLLKDLKVDVKSIFRLSDYLNSVYIANASLAQDNRQNRILYNPAKMSPFLNELMEEVTEYDWYPLKGFTIEQMQQVMSRSKLYVDFGSHPGKDRIPREAAICGCCVITGRQGSARNNVDVPILRKYKFEEKDRSFNSVHDCIRMVMNDYGKAMHDFDGYRDKIKHEEEQFILDSISYFRQKVCA